MKITNSKKRSGMATFFIACTFLSSTILAEQTKKDTLISTLNVPDSYEILTGKIDPSTSLKSYSSISGDGDKNIIEKSIINLLINYDLSKPGMK